MASLARRHIRLSRRSDKVVDDPIALVLAGEAAYQSANMEVALAAFQTAQPPVGSAAAVHAAWVVVFACLWALDERADGSKRDITYPMYYAYATFGSSWTPRPNRVCLIVSVALNWRA